MKKTLLVLLIVLLLTVSIISFAAAGEGPQDGCPPKWHVHTAHGTDHDGHGEHPHHHVGVDTDRNDDGQICVKHVGLGGKVHVHTDNNIPN